MRESFAMLAGAKDQTVDEPMAHLGKKENRTSAVHHGAFSQGYHTVERIVEQMRQVISQECDSKRIKKHVNVPVLRILGEEITEETFENQDHSARVRVRAFFEQS